MVIKNGKIVECTESELFVFWLRRWSSLIDYYSYKDQCKRNGVKIVQESE